MQTKYDRVLGKYSPKPITEAKVKEVATGSGWKHLVFILANKLTQIGSAIELKNVEVIPEMVDEVKDQLKAIKKFKVEGADNKAIKKCVAAVEATMKTVAKLDAQKAADFEYTFKKDKEECDVTCIYQCLTQAFDKDAVVDKGAIKSGLQLQAEL